MARTGLLTALASKLGLPMSEVKRRIMKTIVEAAKLYLARQGVTGHYGHKWFEALKVVAPKVWAIVRSQGRIPTPDEVVGAAVPAAA